MGFFVDRVSRARQQVVNAYENEVGSSGDSPKAQAGSRQTQRAASRKTGSDDASSKSRVSGSGKWHHPPANMSEASQRFVRKYGFGDLPPKQIRRYRSMSLSLLKYAQNLDAKDPRMKWSKKARELIKKAGTDPKARQELENMYHLLQGTAGRMDGGQFLRATQILAKNPKLDLSTSQAQKAYWAVVGSAAYKSGKVLDEHFTPIVNTAVETGATKRSIQAMATYVAKSRRARQKLAYADAALAKLGDKAPGTKDARIYKQHLRKVATAQDPEDQAMMLAGNVSDLAQVRTRQVKNTIIRRYEHEIRTMMKRARPAQRDALAPQLAKAIYDLGGPRTPEAKILLETLYHGVGEREHGAKVAAQAAIDNMVHRTHGFQPATWKKMQKLAFSPHKAPGPKSLALQAAGNFLDIAGTGLDTAGALADIANAAPVAEALGATSVLFSVVGAVASTYQLGAMWNRLEKQENARYSNRIYWGAMEIAAWTHYPSLDSAVKEKSGRFRGNIAPGAAEKAKNLFYDLYRTLGSMPPKRRQTFAEGMLAIRSAFPHLDPYSAPAR